VTVTLLYQKILKNVKQNWTFAYKLGLLITKREIHLQKQIFIFKSGLSHYKWESRSTIHLKLCGRFLIILSFINNNLLFFDNLLLYFEIYKHIIYLKGLIVERDATL